MLCKDCKYFSKNKKYDNVADQMKFGYCHHPSSVKEVSYHTGEIVYTKAQKMRQPIRTVTHKHCGTKARYFLHVDDVLPKEEVCIKSCMSCKYFQLNDTWYSFVNKLEYSYCTHPYSTIIDVVSGTPEYYNAKEMRLNKSDEIQELYLCKNLGLFHEPHNGIDIKYDSDGWTRGDGDDTTKKQKKEMNLLFCWFLMLYVVMILLLKKP